MTKARFARVAALALAAGVAATASSASSQLEITIENLAQPGGFSFTPVYFGFHDGTFDAFDTGSAATPGIELLAETGIAAPGSQPGTVAFERLQVVPTSQGAVIGQPANGIPPIDPGEVATQTVTINDPSSNRFVTFLSMIIPSNDTFFGNSDPLANELFDVNGDFNGTLVIDVTGEILYDAGTEVNDANDGAAFVVGQDINEGTDEGGVITLAPNPDASFVGIETPLGPLDGNLINFADDRANFQVARITITEVVAPVPLPAGAWLGLTAFAALGGLRAMRRRAA